MAEAEAPSAGQGHNAVSPSSKPDTSLAGSTLAQPDSIMQSSIDSEGVCPQATGIHEAETLVLAEEAAAGTAPAAPPAQPDTAPSSGLFPCTAKELSYSCLVTELKPDPSTRSNTSHTATPDVSRFPVTVNSTDEDSGATVSTCDTTQQQVETATDDSLQQPAQKLPVPAPVAPVPATTSSLAAHHLHDGDDMSDGCGEAAQAAAVATPPSTAAKSCLFREHKPDCNIGCVEEADSFEAEGICHSMERTGPNTCCTITQNTPVLTPAATSFSGSSPTDGGDVAASIAHGVEQQQAEAAVIVVESPLQPVQKLSVPPAVGLSIAPRPADPRACALIGDAMVDRRDEAAQKLPVLAPNSPTVAAVPPPVAPLLATTSLDPRDGAASPADSGIGSQVHIGRAHPDMTDRWGEAAQAVGVPSTHTLQQPVSGSSSNMPGSSSLHYARQAPDGASPHSASCIASPELGISVASAERSSKHFKDNRCRNKMSQVCVTAQHCCA